MGKGCRLSKAAASPPDHPPFKGIAFGGNKRRGGRSIRRWRSHRAPQFRRDRPRPPIAEHHPKRSAALPLIVTRPWSRQPTRAMKRRAGVEDFHHSSSGALTAAAVQRAPGRRGRMTWRFSPGRALGPPFAIAQSHRSMPMMPSAARPRTMAGSVAVWLKSTINAACCGTGSTATLRALSRVPILAPRPGKVATNRRWRR